MKLFAFFRRNKAVFIPRRAVTIVPDENKTGFMPTQDEVASRAYFNYVNQGSTPGREMQHWLTAEAELIAEHNPARVDGLANRD